MFYRGRLESDAYNNRTCLSRDAVSPGPGKLVLDPVPLCILNTTAAFDLVRIFALFSLFALECQSSSGAAADQLQIVSPSCHSRVCHSWLHLSSILSAG